MLKIQCPIDIDHSVNISNIDTSVSLTKKNVYTLWILAADKFLQKQN